MAAAPMPRVAIALRRENWSIVTRHSLQMIITYAAPRTEQTPSTGSMPALNRNMARIAPTASANEIGRANVCTPVTNAHIVCRLLLEKKKPHLLIQLQYYTS